VCTPDFQWHVICSNYHENTMPETDFLGAQIAPKSLSAGASPDPTGGAYNAPPDPLAGFKGPYS